MGHDLNVNLTFTADASQAAAQIQSLKMSLEGLAKGQNLPTNLLTDELTSAVTKAGELKSIFNSSINSNGLLDLTSFTKGLKASGTDLKTYADAMYSLGPTGAKTFNGIAQAVSQAEIPLKKSIGLVDNFKQSLLNTLRWNISSSIINRVVGSMQKAYDYAQDLNQSLNNIRIVSGASAEKMSEFAVQANKAAKALNTTTLDYTKGALIYYQQGLSDEEVKKRTDITMKMANVSGQSTEQVSEQLTAVWNNFAKGGENLEHFADAMVRLGADTASSSDEIAKGLEKFAAIGDTVGLSFDNAAAALATVTATTRQSADVVGTAFKTLFARIQDLELGNTLEDGTTLGKYSEALKVVGINIKQQNGELKDMDVILDEMGNKWTTLSKDQQVALAQTVAGTRQYTQLIALMDNFDFYKKNLESAKGADGSLQEQANIYAESWAAASKAVRANLEKIWSALFDDKTFIKLTNAFADIIKFIGNAVEGVGGLKGTLLFIYSIISKIYEKNLASGISKLASNFRSKSSLDAERQALIQEQKDTNNLLVNRTANTGTYSGAVTGDIYKEQALARNLLIDKVEALRAAELSVSQIEKDRISSLSQMASLMGEQVIKSAEIRDNYSNQADVLKSQFSGILSQTSLNTKTQKNYVERLDNSKDSIINNIAGQRFLGNFQNSLDQLNKEDAFKQITQQAQSLLSEINKNDIALDGFVNKLEKVANAKSFDEMTKSINEGVEDSIEGLTNAEAEINRLQEDLHGGLTSGAISENQFQSLNGSLEQARQIYHNLGQAVGDTNEQQANFLRIIQEIKTQINGLSGTGVSVAQSWVYTSQVISQVGMSLLGVVGIIRTLGNENLSGMEKFEQVFSTLLFIVPQLIATLTTLKNVELAQAAAWVASKIGLTSYSEKIIGLIENLRKAKIAGEGVAAANQKLWASLAPVGWTLAIIAAVVIALVAIKKGTEAAAKATKEHAENMKQQQESMEKLVDEAKSLNSEIETLTSKFLEQKAAGQDVGETYSELSKKLTELQSKYQQLGISTDTQKLLSMGADELLNTGDATTWNQGVKQANREASQRTSIQAYETTEASLNAAARSFNKYADRKSREGMTFSTLENGYGSKTMFGQNPAVMDIMRKYENLLDNQYEYMPGIKINFSSAKEFLKSYGELSSLINELGAAGYENTADYEGLIKIQKNLQDYKDTISQNIGDYEIGLGEKTLQEKGIDPTQIQNITDYSSALKVLSEAYQQVGYSAEEAKNKAQGFLNQFSNNETFSLMQTAKDSFNQNEHNQVAKSQQDSLLSGLTNTELKAVARMNFEQVQISNAEDFKAKLQEAVAQVVGEEAEIKLTDAAAKFDLDPEYLSDLGQAFFSMAQSSEAAGTGLETLAKSSDALTTATVNYARQSRAVDDLTENLKDYKQALSKVNSETDQIKKATAKATTSYGKLKSSIADLLGVSKRIVSDKVMDKISMKDLESASKGGIQGLANIRKAYIQTEAEAHNLGDKIDEIFNQMEVTDWHFEINVNSENALAQLMAFEINASHSAEEIRERLSGIGITFDTVQFFDNLTEAENYAAAVGGTIASDLTYTASTETTPTQAEGDQENVEFEEVFEDVPHSVSSETLETNFLDGSTTVKPINYTVKGVKKTVKPLVNSQPFNLTNFSTSQKVEQGGDGKTHAVFTGLKKAPVVPSSPSSSKGSGGGGGGGKGGGGGGGGGGGSTPKVKTKKFNPPPQATEQKKARDEIDRYHTITKQIEALTKAMDLLNEQKDKVWGRKRLELMDQEIKKMQEQKGLLIQEGKEIEKNLALSKSELLTKFPNAKFDSKGNIANYEELKEQAIGAYNSAMSTYDETMKGIYDRKKAIEEEKEGYTDENDPAGEDGYTKRDRLQEEIDDTLAEREYEAGKAKEAAEKAYEEANKPIEYYEETITKQAENLEEMIKLQTEMLDKQVELVDYAYEISKEVKELKKTVIDNAKFKWENDFTKFAELGNLLEQSANISIEDYKKWEETRKKQEEQYIGNRDQYLKWLSENKDNLQDIISGMQDNITGIQEFYENTLDKLDEKWDEYFDKLDYYTNVIDKYKSLSALSGREANQQFIKAFAQAGYQTAAQASDARKSEYLNAKDSYEKMLKKGEAGAIEKGEDVEKFREDLEATRKRMVESQDAWLDSLQDLGERANTLLQSELAIVKETMENEIFGMSLEDYQKELDMLNAKQEDYLTTTNKMYETNKLIRTVQNDMNKTENKVAKERLNNFQKEIKALQENQKVSKTTLSIKQAEYDLLKAQLALEEARNAKDQVRLTRDAEGNFGYVYTANEDKVANAEQAVDDARNKIYNLSLDASKQGQAKWMSTYSEWQSEKERLDEEFRTGKKTRAEYNAAQEKAQSDYYDRLKDIEEEYGLAHDKMIEYAYENQADYLLKGALDIDQFEESSSKALKNSGIAWDEWGKNVKRLTDATGDSFKDTSNKLYDLTEASKKFAEESNKEPDGLVPTLRKQEEAARGTESQLRQTIKTIKEYYDLATGSYKSNIHDPLASSAGEVKDYSQLAIDHLQNLSGWEDMSTVDVIKNSEIRQILDDRRKQKPDSDNIDYQALMDEEARLNGTDTARYKILAAEQFLKIVNTDWSKIMAEYKEATGQEPPDWMYNRKQQKILSKDWLHDVIYPYIRDNLGSNYTADELIENLRYMWYMTELQMISKGFTETEAANEVNRLKDLIKKGIITPRDYGVAYDTGGYTGKWGPEGRLAVLHEKELVLNATDTENFLKSIQVLREISAVLDKNALVAATANLASLKTSFERQPLEQNVQIHAEFPNVQDHNEIEIAIRNLTNAASQYVN